MRTAFASAPELRGALAAALADLDRPAAPPWRSVRGVSLDGRGAGEGR